MDNLHWNISRMECKALKDTLTVGLIRIGIYPEWNVKAVSIDFICPCLPANWNISRMECKGYLCRLCYDIHSVTLEYIQNGM